MKAIKLRTEQLDNPLGIDITKPSLSWICQGGVKQTAYEIEAKADGTSSAAVSMSPAAPMPQSRYRVFIGFSPFCFGSKRVQPFCGCASMWLIILAR